MAALIHELASVVLPVDIHKQRRQLLELRRCDGRTADTAAAFPVCCYAALDDKLIISFYFIVGQPLLAAAHIKRGGDKPLIRTAADKLTAHAAAKNSAYRVNDNGFTCTGLTCQHIEASAE